MMEHTHIAARLQRLRAEIGANHLGIGTDLLWRAVGDALALGGSTPNSPERDGCADNHAIAAAKLSQGRAWVSAARQQASSPRIRSTRKKRAPAQSVGLSREMMR